MSVMTVDELQITIGERITALREKHLMLQVTLANSIGISNTSLSLYEHGHRQQPPWVLIKIARFLGEPLRALISERDDVVGGREE